MAVTVFYGGHRLDYGITDAEGNPGVRITEYATISGRRERKEVANVVISVDALIEMAEHMKPRRRW